MGLGRREEKCDSSEGMCDCSTPASTTPSFRSVSKDSTVRLLRQLCAHVGTRVEDRGAWGHVSKDRGAWGHVSKGQREADTFTDGNTVEQHRQTVCMMDK